MNINNVEYILQPDIERRGEIIQSIRDNDGYCPCVVQKTPDTKCICKISGLLENAIAVSGLKRRSNMCFTTFGIKTYELLSKCFKYMH